MIALSKQKRIASIANKILPFHAAGRIVGNIERRA
jgi:hypothetical protein